MRSKGICGFFHAVRILIRVKRYSVHTEKLVMYYTTFFNSEPPMHLFKNFQWNIFGVIDYLDKEMDKAFYGGVFNFRYEYNACKRFLKVYRKACRHYWISLFLF